MSKNRDTIKQTVIVALLLCVVCSIIVSGAAVILKPIQTKNKLLDRNKNILAAAGIYKESEHGKSDIARLFSQFTVKIVDLEKGKFLSDSDLQALNINVEAYDQRKASKNAALSDKLDKKADIASIGRRAKYATVYVVENNSSIDRIVLPIHGYGLWGTLYGFVALEGDGNTVAGLGFYEHKETPGLGAKVDTADWKAIWPGKRVYDESGKVAVDFTKTKVDHSKAENIHKIDSLSGATLTSNGVENLVRFWMGDSGFGPFLVNLKKGEV